MENKREYASPENFYKRDNEKKFILNENRVREFSRKGWEFLYEYLEKNPIRVNNEGGLIVVVAGEYVVYAAGQLKIKKIPYVVLDRLDKKDADRLSKIMNMKVVSARDYNLAKGAKLRLDSLIERSF